MKKLLTIMAGFFISFSLFAQDSKLEDYVGTYKFDNDAPFADIIVSLENGALMADADGIGKGEISATNEKDEFSEPMYQALLKFLRDGNGKIAKLEVSAQGMSMIGVKENKERNLEDYVGTFVFDTDAPFEDIIVTVEDGVLMVDADGVGKGEVVPTDVEDEFGESQYQALLLFLRDNDGKVNRLEVSAQGMVMTGKIEGVNLSDYAGTYTLEGDASMGDIRVSVQGDVLYVDTGMGGSDLVATDKKDVFQIKAVDGNVAFTRDVNGKVNGIAIMAMGAAMEGSKKK